jgi:transcriptional regulator with XRE-family HTH domain
MNLVPLAQRIRTRRQELGLTLDQVAAATGLTRSFLSKVENFRTTPSLPSLFHIAQALSVTLSELVEGLDERPMLVVVRKDERQELQRDGESAMTYFALAQRIAAINAFVKVYKRKRLFGAGCFDWKSVVWARALSCRLGRHGAGIWTRSSKYPLSWLFWDTPGQPDSFWMSRSTMKHQV